MNCHLFRQLSIFSIFLFGSVQSFDVKVLLKKIALENSLSTEIQLTSKHGFIISKHDALSLGVSYPGQHVTVSAGHGAVQLAGQPVKDKLIYLYPALSKIQQEKLNAYITSWFEENMQDLELQDLKKLHELFDGIVQSSVIDQSLYERIQPAIEEIIEQFFIDFIDSIEEVPAMSVSALMPYVAELFASRMKFLFLEMVASEQLGKQERKMIEKDAQVRYEFFDSKLYAVAQKLMQELLPILPKKLLHQFLKDDASTIEFEKNQYLGAFLLFQEKNQLFVINSLDIDDYLLSVIKHEGWPGWPLEMNKVLCVACRTYLIWQILQAQKIDRPYHIENGIKHQTYKGHHTSAKLKQAIEQTKDMFVSFEDKPALTMYDACCGGIVPAHIDDPGHKKVSYLARTYPCTFCKNFKIFNWQNHFSEAEIVKRLQKEFPKVTKVVSMTVQKKDKAGLVKKVLINVGSRKITVSEKKFKTFFPEIKSYCFDIAQHNGKRFIISGRGFGHHKGLCQWGACKLVRDDGWNFEQVLQFYYPGTKLMKLTYQR